MKEVKKIKTKSKKNSVNDKIFTKAKTKKVVRNSQLKGSDLKNRKEEISKNNNISSFYSKKIILLIIFLILLILVFIVMHFLIPIISLNGLNKVEIPYGSTYVEKGATARYFDKDLTNKLKIINNIDTNKIGTYEVVYIVNYSFYKIKKKRIVKVVDEISPIITLKGEKEVNICPNSDFKEIGYTAIDEYDGDITDKVIIKKDKGKIIYTVKDLSGNVYSISRNVLEKDKEKPIITLKGNSTMYLDLEDEFIEPGYTANDNCSGDLTDKVIVTGKVKEKTEGTYTVTYKVEDESGNTTTVLRKIIVTEKTDPNSGVVKKGTIYLTFDDGPSNVTTGDILNILKEEGIKATFFVTNNGPDYLIKRIYDEGHTIALHTASHNYSKIYSSFDSYFEDLEIVSDRVKRITGYTSKIVRFPGGSSNTVSRRYNKGIITKLSAELFNRGYRYYDWNIDSMDASSAKTKDDVYKNVTKTISKDKMNIVLMHDIKIPTRDALRAIISYGKENGYTFDRIDMDTYMIRQNIRN